MAFIVELVDCHEIDLVEIDLNTSVVVGIEHHNVEDKWIDSYVLEVQSDQMIVTSLDETLVHAAAAEIHTAMVNHAS